jgi:hypothetical protein
MPVSMKILEPAGGGIWDTTSHDAAGPDPPRERKRVMTHAWPRTSCSTNAHRRNKRASGVLQNCC